MKVDIDIWLNVLAVILFLGFGTAAMIAFSTIDKQKEITINSRYGRQTGPLEILYVNIAMLLIAFMLHHHSYRFMPALLVFILLIFFNSRMQSGIAPIGIFIGTTYLEWGKINSYLVVNDEISTIQIRVYANKKQYVLRCDKESRIKAEAYFKEHDIPYNTEMIIQEDGNETFN